MPFTESAEVHLFTGSHNCYLVLSDSDKISIRIGTMARSKTEILLKSTFRTAILAIDSFLFE